MLLSLLILMVFSIYFLYLLQSYSMIVNAISTGNPLKSCKHFLRTSTSRYNLDRRTLNIVCEDNQRNYMEQYIIEDNYICPISYQQEQDSICNCTSGESYIQYYKRFRPIFLGNNLTDKVIKHRKINFTSCTPYQ